jgi:hypothetical protein
MFAFPGSERFPLPALVRESMWSCSAAGSLLGSRDKARLRLDGRAAAGKLLQTPHHHNVFHALPMPLIFG